jgi:hypothetical protein
MRTVWDSRFYQLTGLQILDGERPYRDFWELKPPGMFYLMALGGLVSDTSLVPFAVLDGAFNLLTLLVASRISGSWSPCGKRRLQLAVAARRSRLAVCGIGCRADQPHRDDREREPSECYVFLPESLSVAAGSVRYAGRSG